MEIACRLDIRHQFKILPLLQNGGLDRLCKTLLGCIFLKHAKVVVGSMAKLGQLCADFLGIARKTHVANMEMNLLTKAYLKLRYLDDSSNSEEED